MRTILMTLFLCATCCAGFSQGPSEAVQPTAAQFRNARLSYKIIPAANGTWCYDVYADGRKMIHQPSVPGLPGTEGFKTKEGAERVAQLVIRKIRNGQMPPSVDISEMKKLKAL